MRRTTDEYVARITQFHIHRPKFTDTVEGVTSALVEVNNFALDLPAAFDLDFAIGVQLDVVGQWIGRARFVPYPLNSFWFTFDDDIRGFDLGVWKGAYESDFGTYRLDDNLYRRLLYANIGTNYWDGTTESAEKILLGFYDNPSLSPNSLFFFEARGDKSATIAVAGKHPPPLILAMMMWQAVPIKVAGEEMRYRVVSITESSFFGFDVNNEYVSGFDSGVWGVSPLSVIFASDPGRLDFSDPVNSMLTGAM